MLDTVFVYMLDTVFVYSGTSDKNKGHLCIKDTAPTYIVAIHFYL